MSLAEATDPKKRQRRGGVEQPTARAYRLENVSEAGHAPDGRTLAKGVDRHLTVT